MTSFYKYFISYLYLFLPLFKFAGWPFAINSFLFIHFLSLYLIIPLCHVVYCFWGRLIWFFFAVKIFPETLSPGTRKFCSSFFLRPLHLRFPAKLSTNFNTRDKGNPTPLLFPQLYLQFPAKFSTNFNTFNKVTPHPSCSSLNYIYGFRQKVVPN
jgi:hypothetical protein